jgi:putative membrane protein
VSGPTDGRPAGGPDPVDPTPDPRFLLANERTLLAWMRTSLAFVATGLGLIALRHAVVHQDWPLYAAVGSCAVGVVIAAWAYPHWRRIDLAIRTGRQLPPPSIAPLMILGLVLVAATGIVAAIRSP